MDPRRESRTKEGGGGMHTTRQQQNNNSSTHRKMVTTKAGRPLAGWLGMEESCALWVQARDMEFGSFVEGGWLAGWSVVQAAAELRTDGTEGKEGQPEARIFAVNREQNKGCIM